MTASFEAIRARLWLTAHEYGEASEAALLWLHLADRRVLAFRLAALCHGNDALIPAIVEGIADDARGEVLALRTASRITDAHPAAISERSCKRMRRGEND